MFKQFIKLFLVFTICAGLLIEITDSTKAQSILSSDQPSISDQKPANFESDPNVVTWEMLGLVEANLVGPYDSYNFSFIVPSDWKLIEGASLNLSVGLSGIQDPIGTTNSDPSQLAQNNGTGAGTLTVLVNEVALAILPLTQSGEIVNTIPIPANLLTSANDGYVTVKMILSSGASCYSFQQVNVAIRASSYFTFPHDSAQPSTNLVNFPRPIFQNSFISDSALLIIPDQPSSADLQAALTVASGLGKLSNGGLILDMVTLGKLTSEQEAANHLIFVGKPASLPILRQVQLPLSVDAGSFQVAGAGADDGFVQMVNSPWNIAKVILVVSGNTDNGMIKAAQAVSTGVFQPNAFPNLAVVQEVQTVPVLASQPTDQSLASLGYKGKLFENRGVSSSSFYFNVPPGWTVASDAHFELVFGHSALLNYDTSGIIVLLNGKPIGSVRMNDASANLSTNKVLINIPPSAVVPGRNRLDVRVNLAQLDLCSPPNMRGLWVNIWPESTLHLPLDLTLLDPISNLSLASYPAPFIYYPLLDNTAFVLMKNDLESWRSAVVIAAYLGANTSGSVTALKAYYGDDIPEGERSKHNLLIIGRPSQMSIVGEINKTLPIPFLEGSDILAESNFQVTYRIPPDAPMGYMELMPSPWNSDNIVLAVLGNTAQGLSWATSSLIDPALRSKLAGNFAVINDQQIITTDTRLSPTIKPQATQVADAVAVQPGVDINPSLPVAQQAAWVFPVLVGSIALIVLILAFVAIGSWSRHRTRGNLQRGERQSVTYGLLKLIQQKILAFFEKMKNRQKNK